MSTGLIPALCMLMLLSSSSVQGGTSVVQASRPASSVTISPEKIDFSPQTVQTASQPTVATLTNVSGGNVAVRDISASGIDFTETNDCPATLVSGASCKIAVTFTPAITGPRLGTIIVSVSERDNPLFLVLSGTGA